jgi:hypothetical protein
MNFRKNTKVTKDNFFALLEYGETIQGSFGIDGQERDLRFNAERFASLPEKSFSVSAKDGKYQVFYTDKKIQVTISKKMLLMTQHQLEAFLEIFDIFSFDLYVYDPQLFEEWKNKHAQENNANVRYENLKKISDERSNRNFDSWEHISRVLNTQDGVFIKYIPSFQKKYVLGMNGFLIYFKDGVGYYINPVLRDTTYYDYYGSFSYGVDSIINCMKFVCENATDWVWAKSFDDYDVELLMMMANKTKEYIKITGDILSGN